MSDSENNEEQVVTLVSPLAKPLASDKLTARIFKLIKKGLFSHSQPIIICIKHTHTFIITCNNIYQ